MRAYQEVAVIVLLRGDGAALLQHRDDKRGLPLAGRWVPPGGHCEPGESSEDCARREFAEETAYRLGEDLHLLLRYDNDTPEELCRHTVYWAMYDDKQTPRCLEGQELRFIEREHAVAFAVPEYLVRMWDAAIAAAAIPDGASDRQKEGNE